MSQQGKGPSGTAGNQTGAGDQERRRLEVKKVPLKVSPSAVPNVQYQADDRLPESIVVLVVSANRTEAYTLHHPVGITDLTEGDWVLTRTSEVPTLLARAKDPNQKKVDEARQKARSDYLVAAGLLTRVGETLHYLPGVAGGKERNAVLGDADVALKAARVKEKLDFEQSKPSEQARKNFRSRLERDSFLDPEVVKHESKIREALTPEVLEREVMGKVPQTYRTMGGPLAGTAQSRAFPPGAIRSKEMAFDELVKILHPLTLTGGVTQLRDNLSKRYPSAARKEEEPAGAKGMKST